MIVTNASSCENQEHVNIIPVSYYRTINYAYLIPNYCCYLIQARDHNGVRSLAVDMKLCNSIFHDT